MLTRFEAMKRLGIEDDVLDMLIDRGEIRTARRGGEEMILIGSVSAYEKHRQDQASALDDMAELTEDLCLLGMY